MNKGPGRTHELMSREDKKQSIYYSLWRPMGHDHYDPMLSKFISQGNT